ncbi:DUF2283 domain-containing protein [Aetokthonos hydrillicola Thurmond2011]|jgi:hypothetical protein|uniref:DUF2283 domain-containing protein n=1 Tax=Aetokthonos hydrillicola Thurmond2011 TaxID=2712845 RepID=A0AAP5I4B9_9CYAN|nr:DUF2283 domain-containing protein [Aetokthonos hydrillicola]MBO3462150.1 DUF2283 domain-containing protein [Aetokthonos hydrillicola CCALA 1050]MBW4587846.1 DUF2283 domain-containing protein [Aetokthonos hydrillicola CCALA 1050]MDR9894494.1 DUF2283 domain-containing protein [Aetokthonos hydrillicola Thurmond2011]
MGAKLRFEYDHFEDILSINTLPPYPEQEPAEIDYGVIARLNPTTGEIENLEILFFSKRLSEKTPFELPLKANFDFAFNK